MELSDSQVILSFRGSETSSLSGDSLLRGSWDARGDQKMLSEGCHRSHKLKTSAGTWSRNLVIFNLNCSAVFQLLAKADKAPTNPNLCHLCQCALWVLGRGGEIYGQERARTVGILGIQAERGVLSHGEAAPSELGLKPLVGKLGF